MARCICSRRHKSGILRNKMRKAIIVNSIRDAEHLVAAHKALTQDALIFSTHAAVDVYLKEKHQLDCRCLSMFVPAAQMIDNIKLSDRCAEEITGYLDARYSPGINTDAGLPKIRFFRALYVYTLYQHFIACFGLCAAVDAMVQAHRIEEIVFFDRKINAEEGFNITLADVLAIVKNVRTVCLPEARSSRTAPEHPPVSRWELALRYPSLAIRKPFSGLWAFILKSRYRFLVKNRAAILLLEPLYDFSFLHQALLWSGCNVLYYEFGSSTPTGVNPSVDKSRVKSFDVGKYENPHEPERVVYFKDLFIRDVGQAFNKNADRYVRCLRVLDGLNARYTIRLGVWGNSPVSWQRSLIAEYLLQQNKPVIGYQHGGLFANLYNDDVFLCDLSRCTDYVSYGFDKNDVAKVYPDKNMDGLTIHALGSTKCNRKAKSCRPVIDILFPITNTISMLEGGMKRNAPDIIARTQVELIRGLAALSGCRIAVKPFPHSDYENLAALPVLEKVKNIDVIRDLSLTTVLNIYNIKAIVFEHHTTTLYEALAYDLEIFLVNNDAVRPLEAGALDDLKKRVHYFESVRAMMPALELFLAGKLEKKRDSSFYDHHVHREGTRNKAFKLVEALAGAQHHG